MRTIKVIINYVWAITIIGTHVVACCFVIIPVVILFTHEWDCTTSVSFFLSVVWIARALLEYHKNGCIEVYLPFPNEQFGF